MACSRPGSRVHGARGTTPNVDRALVNRARGEYLEMPCLSLTATQAARLWAMDAPTCAAVLEVLVTEGFLEMSRVGTYRRVGTPTRPEDSVS